MTLHCSAGQRLAARGGPRAPRRGGRPRRRCARAPRSAPRCPRRWRAGGRGPSCGAARRSRGCGRCRGPRCAPAAGAVVARAGAPQRRGTPPARRPRRRCACRSSGRRARTPRSRGARRRPRTRRASPRRTSCMRSSSARFEQSGRARRRDHGRRETRPDRITGRAGDAPRRRRRLQRALGEVEQVVGLRRWRLFFVAHAQDHEAGARGGADGDRDDRAHPVARVAHRAELPRLELLGGQRR